MNLKIEAIAWCDHAAAALASSIRGAPCYTVADLEAEIRAGATLFQVASEAGELVGYVVLKIDRYQGGSEGVILAGAGKLTGAALYGQLIPAFERMFTGVKTFRIDSCRPGASAVLLELGYLPTHVTWRKVAKPAELELAGDDRLEALSGAYQEAQHGDGRRGSAGGDIRSRPGKPHGGGGGASTSSSTQQTVNTDRRLVTDNGAIAVSSDNSVVSINTLDGGAIQQAFEFAKLNDQETGKTLQSVLGIAAGVFDKASANVDASAELVAKAYDDAKGDGTLKTVLSVTALAMTAFVAIKVFAK